MSRTAQLILAIAALALSQVPVGAQSLKPSAGGQVAGQFGWFAELVSFDPATNTMTARARVEPHVAKFDASLAKGDRIVLLWSQFKGEADAIRYVASEKAISAESGFLVRAKFVSADAAGKTLTFATRVPETTAGVLATAKPGTPVRVAAPMLQPGPDAAVASVALNKTAPPRPVPIVTKSVEASARPVGGKWILETALQGNAIKLDCDFTQDGKKLGGECKGPGPLGTLAVGGGVDGDSVTIQFEISSFGPTITLLHKGTLSAPGTTIEGMLNFLGSDSPFKATKQ